MDGTKGVWMLGSPILNEARDIHILFLDFEGFPPARHGAGVGGKSQKSNADKAHRDMNNKLFALCAMLSSTLCFNIVKTFSADTI